MTESLLVFAWCCLFCLLACVLVQQTLICLGLHGRQAAMHERAASWLLPVATTALLIVAQEVGAEWRVQGVSLSYDPRLAAVAALALTDTALTAIVTRRAAISEAATVSNQSIREGLDHLPAGLFFSAQDGLVLLSNNQMEGLCRDILGEPLMNGNHVWTQLSSTDPIEGVQRIANTVLPTFQLPDGTVWIFNREEIMVDGEMLWQTLAYDVTDAFQLAYDVTDAFQLGFSLRNTNAQLAAMNERLGTFGAQMVETVRNEEILRAKTLIHDNIGQALMATRLYLAGQTGDSFQEDRLLKVWKNNIALLRNESHATPPTPVANYLQDAGKAVGIDIVVEGELPVNDEAAMRIVNFGARECMTNAVRHAKAKTLTIQIQDCGAWWKMQFANDGEPPAPGFREGGGLGGLRRQVEQRGGVMITHAQEHFKVQMLVPKSNEEA